jgi:hypothetical protein
VFGVTEPNWVAATPALPNAGAIELDWTGTEPGGRAMVGGDWASEAAGLIQADTGLNWTATGDPTPPGFAAGADTRGMLDDWRNLFNPHSPSFWALAAVLVAVGFLHLRVNTKFGPAHGNFHVG